MKGRVNLLSPEKKGGWGVWVVWGVGANGIRPYRCVGSTGYQKNIEL
ncbi:MAG: hypothetical protein F6K39_34465 [Okeania sp. SIO3B3]|nr:hypothetical protein [Okeania sp. SIO3B3]